MQSIRSISVVGCHAEGEVGATGDDFTHVSTLLFERVRAVEPLPVRETTTPWVFTNRGSS